MSESSLDRIASALEDIAVHYGRIAHCWELETARHDREENRRAEARGYDREVEAHAEAREDRLAEVLNAEREASRAYFVDARATANLDAVRIREEIERGRRSDAAAESYAMQVKEILRDAGKDGGA